MGQQTGASFRPGIDPNDRNFGETVTAWVFASLGPASAVILLLSFGLTSILGMGGGDGIAWLLLPVMLLAILLMVLGTALDVLMALVALREKNPKLLLFAGLGCLFAGSCLVWSLYSATHP